MKAVPARKPRHVEARPRLDVENDLLALAQGLSTLAQEPAAEGALVAAALWRLQDAFAPGRPLPRRFFGTSVRTRKDKTAALTFAWAREQVLRALGEILEREGIGGRIRADVPIETLSWLLLSGSEATAHDPPDAARDRVAMLLDFVRPPKDGP